MNGRSVVVIRPQAGVAVTSPTLTSPAATPAAEQPPPAAPVAEPPAAPPVPEGPAEPPPPAGEVLFDFWFAAAVDGQRIGYVHWYARKIEKDGRQLVHATKYRKFTVSRFGQPAVMTGEESTIETPDGTVLVVSSREEIGRGQMLAITGTVDGDVLRVKGEGAAAGAKDKPWPAGVVGIAREPFLVRDRRPKPGESFAYLQYVPSFNMPVRATVTMDGEEMATLWAGLPPRKTARLTSRMDPVGPFKLPANQMWCDAETLEPLRVEFDFPALGGRVTFLRTTDKAASAPLGKLVELFNVQSIPVNRLVPGIEQKDAVTYRVALKNEDDPGSAFSPDWRQRVVAVDPRGKTVTLRVADGNSAPPADVASAPEPGPEYLGSSFFVTTADARVQAHAKAAVGGLPPAATAWQKAQAVERWVNRNMRQVEFSQAMATAGNVATTLAGDCTEHAMLAAAMCRAVGVPARTALGLIYYAPPGAPTPVLAYHMWFEVYADGRWRGLDAIHGKGGIGPGYLKITEHSWHDEQSFAPLLPVLRVLMAKPTVEVVRVEP